MRSDSKASVADVVPRGARHRVQHEPRRRCVTCNHVCARRVVQHPHRSRLKCAPSSSRRTSTDKRTQAAPRRHSRRVRRRVRALRAPSASPPSPDSAATRPGRGASPTRIRRAAAARARAAPWRRGRDRGRGGCESARGTPRRRSPRPRPTDREGAIRTRRVGTFVRRFLPAPSSASPAPTAAAAPRSADGAHPLADARSRNSPSRRPRRCRSRQALGRASRARRNGRPRARAAVSAARRRARASSGRASNRYIPYVTCIRTCPS